jgi:hypothetical protein
VTAPSVITGLPGFWSAQGDKTPACPLSWLWHGYLAAGNVTLLTSQWKSGKTTLLAVLLARMASGGQLAGLAVKPARALVISEECHLNWQQRALKLHFGSNIGWLCRPFAGKPSKEDWSLLIDALVQARHREGIDLVAIDPLVNFLPGHQENSADGLIGILLMLQRLTTLGVAVLILHHPRKGQVRAGQAARGSGVLGGYADILLEMHWYSQPADPDRRRVIEGYSRHEETPRRLVIELTAEGTDYVSHGDLSEEDFTASWKIVHALLEASERPLTRAEIRQRWPHGRTKPDEATIWRWLQRRVGEGAVIQQGAGRRNDPFRFGLVRE